MSDVVVQGGVSAETLRSISTPDRVESRLGTLEFVDGAPTEATAAHLMENDPQLLDNRRGRAILSYLRNKAASRDGQIAHLATRLLREGQITTASGLSLEAGELAGGKLSGGALLEGRVPGGELSGCSGASSSSGFFA